MLHLHKNKSLHRFAGGFAKPESSGLRAADRHRPAIATTPIASPPIPPNGNMPPTSSTSSRRTRRGAACCAASIARTTSAKARDAQFVVADTTRKTFSPGLAALAASVRRQAQASGDLSDGGRRARGRFCAARAAARRPAPARQRKRYFRRSGLGQYPAAMLSSHRRHRRGLRLRLSVRLDSVRRAHHPARRRARCPLHRLRQYRRHQCACAPAERPRRGDASRRHAQRHCRGRHRQSTSSAATPRSCAALGAFLGHLFPVWLGFKGGKGVATFIGLLLGFGAWIALVAFAALWLAIAAVTRYSSLAALIASAATPAVLWWSGNLPEAELFLLLAVLLWIMHRANIARLAHRHRKQDRQQIGAVTIRRQRPPARAPARRGCAGSCRQRPRRNDRSRRLPVCGRKASSI